MPPREDVATLGRLADETSEEIPTEIYPFLLASANVGVPHWPNPTGSLRGMEPTDWSMSSQPLWEGGRREGGGGGRGGGRREGGGGGEGYSPVQRYHPS